MDLEFSWWLALPLLLSFGCGYTVTRAKLALNLYTQKIWASWSITTLGVCALTVTWSISGFPLPILYLLIYFVQAASQLSTRSVNIKNWFLLNLSFINSMGLHLIIIGAVALIQGTAIEAQLANPFWRALSISAALLVLLLQSFFLLWWPGLSNMLSAQAESEEARPFMSFLWFCVAYLLIDSALCVFEPEPMYPPLFLIGSSAVVLFTLLRFLLHINTLLKNNHLKEEHDMLASRLEATEASVDTLNQLARRDVLTGVLSRRYAMEHIDALITAGTPFSLVFLDLDALKQINDTQGHDAGDAYLIAFAGALGCRLRSCDLLARVGGDEFIVLMPGCTGEDAAARIQGIRTELEQGGQDAPAFRFSYGVTTLQGGRKDPELLIREADRAMYQDKMQRRQKESGV